MVGVTGSIPVAPSYAVAAAGKHRYALTGRPRAAVDLARATILDALASICSDVVENPALAPRSGATIGPMHVARTTLMHGLMSLYWFWGERSGWPVPAHKDFLEGWLPGNFSRNYLWGEGAIPQFLAHYWYMARKDPTVISDAQFGNLVHHVVAMARGKLGQPFPSPYFAFEQVQRHTMKSFLPLSERDALANESSNGRTFTGKALLDVFARTNRKQSCQLLWPELTRLLWCRFIPESIWAYGLAHCERGTEYAEVPALGKRWPELVEDARDCRTPHVPSEMRADEILLALFIIVFPYRAIPEVIRYLDWKLGSAWMILPPFKD
jgi:hypothetical protein